MSVDSTWYVIGIMVLLLGQLLLIGALLVQRHRRGRAEEALRISNETLERRVANRTALLQANEARYHSLFNSMTEGFALHEIICDVAGKPVDYRFIEINPAFERLTGLSRETVTGKTVRQIMPEIEPYWIETYGRVALGGKPVHIENYSAPLNRWFEAYAYQTIPGFFAVFFTDITERKRAEEALRESEKRLNRAQEIAHLGSWELDLTRNELIWSDEVYRIFGLAPQEFAATYETFLDHVHPDDRTAVNEAYAGSIREGRDSYEIEHRVVRRSSNGEIRFVHEKCQHVRDKDGQIIRSLGMVLDITDRKKALESLKRSNQELEQFAYVASHDLQEPLRAIVGFLQLLRSRYEDKVDEKGKHYIERSVKAAHRMQTLIRELLTLSRVHSKGSTFLPTDLNLLVRSVVDNLQATVEEKNAEVICGVLPTLSIDANQMRSLFQNLVQNALQYNVSPVVRVQIGFQELDDSYRFQVQDNGIGISPQFHQRIFMVFQRLHTDSEYPGTGLGLALCKKIIERHGGTIRVESNPTGGSIFCFTLPKDM